MTSSTPDVASPGVDIVGDTLVIEGTPGDDRILIRATLRPDTVRVILDGVRHGAIGPVARIVVNAGDGDDIVFVGRAVRLPARLNGGPGDDFLRGGSGPDLVFGEDGDDVLVASRGRDGLDGGPGGNRLVVRRSMGEIRVGPSATGDALRILSKAYDLRPLDTGRAGARHASAPESGPIVVGPADLLDDDIVDLLTRSYQAGHTIALAGAEAAGADLLRNLLGHASGGSWDADIPLADLVAFRRSVRPDGRIHESTTILLPRGEVDLPRAEAGRGPREADMLVVERLSGVFSGTPVVPDPPPADDGPVQNLLNLADSYQSSVLAQDADGDQVQLVNSVWDARSFQNRIDLYYVLQEIDYHGRVFASPFDRWNTEVGNALVDPDAIPTTIEPSPPTTLETTTLTSGVSQSFGSMIGFNQTQGLNVTDSQGVTISNSKTVTVPPVVVNYEGNLATGETAWNSETNFNASSPQPPPRTVTFFNQWIWEVPFAAYAVGQPDITLASAATLGWPVPVPSLTANLSSVVPLPFGNTFALQKPAVASVDPTSVFAGDEFTITGTGLYPSLVTAVLIDSEPLDGTQFTPVSDTEITAVAPDTFGIFLPVVVQTTEGFSGDNVTIEIIGLPAAPAGGTASVVARTPSAAAVKDPKG